MSITISKIKPEDALGARIVLRDTWLATYPNKLLLSKNSSYAKYDVGSAPSVSKQK